MGRGVYLALADNVRTALIEVAEREYRSPREQIEKFIVESLQQVGALPVASSAESEPGRHERADERPAAA